jgi:hypothetical protein
MSDGDWMFVLGWACGVMTVCGAIGFAVYARYRPLRSGNGATKPHE